MLRILAVLLSLLFCSSFATHFIFSTTFDCKFYDRDSYSYMVQFLEYDVWIPNDVITNKHIATASIGKSRFELQGRQYTDQAFSAGYEPFAEIWHDCTKDRKVVRLLLFFRPLCPNERRYCHYDIRADLTQRWGEETVKAPIRYDDEPFDDQ